MKIRGICFDMDGLLMDSEPVSAEMQVAAVALQGFHVEDWQLLELLGVNKKTTTEKMLQWFPGISPAQAIKDWGRLMLQAVADCRIPPKPYADHVLRELKKRDFRLALCSSNTAFMIEAYLRETHWDDGLFDAVVSGDHIEHGKPDPEIYLEGAKKLGLEPGECMGVEDSPNGVISLRAAGMKSVMIPDWLPYNDKLKPYVDVVFPDLRGLLDPALY